MNTKTTMKSLFAAAAFGAVIPAAFAESSIAIDSVTQRWPWNNKVDITYTVTDGQNREAGVYAGVDFTIAVPGKAPYLVHGYELGASAETGGEGSKQHTATWTAPSGVKATDCTITATLFPTNVPSGNDYMIVDLSSGAVVYEGLMATQDLSNGRYNVNDYKTGSKLVLRKIPKWSEANTLPNYADRLASLTGYPTGHSDFSTARYKKSDGKNSPAKWQTDRDYYIGVFDLTTYQYRLVTGESGTKNATPQGSKTMGMYRNGTLSDVSIDAISAVSSDTGTFFQRLNYRTGLYFDLPTELMHEIAARAGVTKRYIWDADVFDDEVANRYISFKYNNADGPTEVGKRLPNEWGLYDMAGLKFDAVLGNATMMNGAGNQNDLADRTDPFQLYNEEGSVCMRTKGGGRNTDPSSQDMHLASYRKAWTVADTGYASYVACRVAYVCEK